MSEYLWIPALFLLMSLLFALEASTSLARVAGLNTNNLASGLQLQSGLSLFSRVLMAIFLPALGALADAGKFNPSNLNIIFSCTAFIPIFIYLTLFFKKGIVGVYQHTTGNLVSKGTYFPIGRLDNIPHVRQRKKYQLRNLKIFRVVTFLSYVPYYLTWTVIITLLSIFPGNRGMILGLSSVMNGINTLALIMCVDPFLIKLCKNKRLSNLVYHDQLNIRLLSAVFSSTPFIVGAVYISLNG